jgi:DNA-binding transcriptional ArsR family regulator
MEEVDWSSLHKILSDTTRRSILELLAEKEGLSYTEIMSLLQITNTGRLNYHLKALGALVLKDDQGKYSLTERGKLAANMLKTFPERAPMEKKKRSTLKIVVAALSIFLGILLIFSVIFFTLSLPLTASSTVNVTVPDRVIPQNTTAFLTSLVVQSNASQLNMDWSASNPVYIYVLNSSQYDGLLLQHSTDGQIPTYLANFTGMLSYYVVQYDLQKGSVSLTLSQGQYYFFAGSNSNAILDSLSLTLQLPQVTSGSSPSEYLIAAVPGAIGTLLVVLGVLILTQRIWR